MILAWPETFSLPPLEAFGVTNEVVKNVVAYGSNRNSPANLVPCKP